VLKVLFSVFCCITFLIPTVILYVVVSYVHGMPFKVESGDVNVLCLLAFVFAVVAVVTVVPRIIAGLAGKHG